MSLWEDLVSAALLGTGRKAFDPPPDATALGALLAGLDRADPEGVVLGAAAALCLHRRAGFMPGVDHRPLPVACPLDDLPRCGPRAAQHLALMIQGHHQEALPEWLGAVAAAGKRVPEEVLPDLLDFGREKPELREAVLNAVGARGRWLAAQDPKWAYWTAFDAAQSWEQGDVEARLGLLRALRRTDPDHARALLIAAWPNEKPDERLKYLETFAVGLSMADEPFLEEAALEDRSKRVRSVAARLLSTLPESRLAQRMTARVAPLLEIKRVGLLRPKEQIAVTFPDAYDDSLARDGITEKPVHARPGVDGKTWWLLQMLQAVPPAYWSQAWGRAPADLVEIAARSVKGEVVLEAWAVAAGNYRDPDWAEALVPFVVKQADQSLMYGLVDALPPARREAIALEMLKDKRKPLRSSHPALTLLRLSAHPWSEELARAVLENWRRYLERGNARPDPEMREALKRFAHSMPPTVYDEAHAVLMAETVGGKIWDHAATEFLVMLEFRRDMLAAIAA